MNSTLPDPRFEPDCSSFQTADAAERELRRHRLDLLEDKITELSAHIHSATYRLLVLIREYDEKGGWAAPGLMSCAHWLNWKCGISMGAAREKVRVAHALKELPKISAVFREGRVSYSKIRAMTRVATKNNEDYLLMIATHGTASHVERLVRNYRKVKRTEALQLENERHARRELRWHFDDDNCWILRGRFTPEDGAAIHTMLERVMEEYFQEQKDVPAEISDEDFVEPDPEPVAARRADALVRMAQSYGSAPSGSCGAGSCGGDRFLVHVHTESETLKADGTGTESEIEGFGTVCAETTRRLACDAGVVHWLEHADGEPLSIGRKSRTIPPAIRRALQRRDGGCRFPGCTCSRFVDAHHIQHWADGGETSMDNLVFLCRNHHRLVHEGGFGLHKTSAGEIHFNDPAGNVIQTGPDTRSRGNFVNMIIENDQSGICIMPNTQIPNWLGEKMDDQLAVEGLLFRE